MNIFQKVMSAGALAAMGLAIAAPSQAGTVVTFAQYFEQKGVGPDMRWVNKGASAELMTISNPSSKVLGATKVDFTFLNDPFGSIKALLTYDATTASAATGNFDQPGLNGSFSFVADQAFSYGGNNYAAGANLLSATFFNFTDITGKKGGTSGSVFASTGSGSTINYTSGVLAAVDLGPDRDFSFTLTGANPKFGYLNGKPLNNFIASSTGSFSADPLPEPANWALMITGFSMLGLLARRQRRADVVVA